MVSKKSKIYCGNNSNATSVVNGSKKIGNRYSCLKQGIGVGINIPISKDFSLVVIPIDKTRIYCGLKKRLPKSYDRFGNLPNCQAKGVGIGMKIQSTRK